jgi:CHAT domain
MTYHDFILRIEAGTGTDSTVHVLTSPAGEGKGLFRLPWSPEEVHQLSVSWNLPARSSTPQKLGEDLFSALFQGQPGLLLAQSLGRLGANDGLRLQLRFPQSSSELQALPWELLYLQETGEFFGLNRKTPIVRYLELPRPAALPPSPPPSLQILIVPSQWPGTPWLDLTAEQRQLEEAWSRSSANITLLQPATVRHLRETLLQRPVHFLHFSGHGEFDPETGEGALRLPGEPRKYLSSSMLAALCGPTGVEDHQPQVWDVPN